MDLTTFQWLLTDPGQQLLAVVSAERDTSMQAGQRHRRTHTAEQVTAAFGIVELRAKARAKFGELAEQMYLTRDALEQATRWPVARHRAGRLTAFAPKSVIDLGCGIGGDLIAMSAAGLTVAGIDTDPLRATMAAANLAALGLPGAVQVADATALNLAGFEVAFADPARRGGAGRSFRAEDWVPPWEFVELLLAQTACVKVAPGIPHDLIPDRVEAEWVSDHGQLKEAALWSGPLATVVRRATVIGDNGLATITDEDASVTDVVEVAEFLYEPDDAVIRAGLVGGVAAGVRGGLVDPKIAWVTSPDLFHTPFATSYRVVEEVPFREKQLRAALRDRGIGRLTIKKRGVQVTPEQLRSRLQLRGDNEATLVLTRVAGAGSAFLVERC